MRSTIFASFLVVSALAFVGCAAEVPQTDDEGDSVASVQSDALSKLGKAIVGNYKGDAWYPRFELLADGTYTWDTGIRCVTTPCPSGDAGKWAIYRGTSGTPYVNLASKPAGTSRWFRIYDGKPVVLKGAFGTDGKFTQQIEPPVTKCMTVRCAAGYTCVDDGTTAGCVPLSKDYCNVAADCVLVDDYCGGCNCLPLATWATPPSCTDPVKCFAEPCMNKKVACVSNHCVVQ